MTHVNYPSNFEQSQNNASAEEEQAGIEQRKSAAQIGSSASQNQQSQPNGARDSGE